MTLGGGLAVRERRVVLGLLLLIVVLTLFLAGMVWVGTTDPYGLQGAPPILPSDVRHLEPLYGGDWTPTRSIDWSPDGRWLALAGGESDDVLILSAASGTVVHVLSPTQYQDAYTGLLPGSPVAARWSRDGRFLAVGANTGFFGTGWLHIYTAEGDHVASWQALPDFLETLAWSPNGTQIAAFGAGYFRIWDVGSQTLLHSLENLSSDVMDWSPDGRMIALGSTFGFSLYDAATATQILQVGSGGPNSTYVEQGVAWSHSGAFIGTAGESGCAYLYDRTGTLLWRRDLLGTGCASMWGRRPAWSPSDSMLAVPTDVGIVVLDAATGQTLRTLAFPVERYGPSAYLGGPPNASLDWDVAWSPEGTAIASVADRSSPSLHVWGIPRGGSLALLSAASEVTTLIGIAFVLGGIDPILRPLGPRGKAWGSSRYGALLLVAWLVMSVLEALRLEVIRRAYEAWFMPPAGWFLGSGVLSLIIGAPAVAYVVATFGGLAVRTKNPLALRESVRILGPALIPIVWCVSLGLLAMSILFAAGLEASFALTCGIAGAAGGVGLVWAGLAASAALGTTLRRSTSALLASGAMGILVAFGGTVALVFGASGLFPAIVGPDVRFYGLSVFFDFGVTPLIAAAIVLVLAAGGSGLLWAYPPRVALALFSRLTRDDVVRLDARRRVLEHLRAHPGVHFRQLMRSLGMGSGNLHYHLYVLEREGLVVPRRDGMYRRFFLAGKALP